MRTRLLIATILVALVAGACGDDDVLPSTPAPDGDTVPSSPFGDDAFTGSDADDCLSVVLAWSQAAAGAFTGDGTFEESAEAVESLAAAVPSAIAADFAIYAQALRDYGEALAAAGVVLSDPSTYSTPDGQAAATAASEAFNSPEVQDAATRISEYLETQCAGVGG